MSALPEDVLLIVCDGVRAAKYRIKVSEGACAVY
jgi:hypothetical protein